MFLVWRTKPVEPKTFEAVQWNGTEHCYQMLRKWGAPVVVDDVYGLALTVKKSRLNEASSSTGGNEYTVPLRFGDYVARLELPDGEYDYFEIGQVQLAEGYVSIAWKCPICNKPSLLPGSPFPPPADFFSAPFMLQDDMEEGYCPRCKKFLKDWLYAGDGPELSPVAASVVDALGVPLKFLLKGMVAIEPEKDFK